MSKDKGKKTSKEKARKRAKERKQVRKINRMENKIDWLDDRLLDVEKEIGFPSGGNIDPEDYGL
jgi:hypothetical protein